MALTSQEIRNWYDDSYNKNYYAWNDFYPFADRDLRYYLSDQWDEAEKQAMYQDGRSTFVYNYIRPKINMVSGYQKKHRHSSVVVPVESNDQQTADQLTKLLLYVMQHGDGYEMISECFRGGLITGWNLMAIWKDYRDDPVDGDIRFGRIPYNGFICDPYFTKRDMSDASNICRRNYLSLEMTKSLLPKYKKDLDLLYKIGWERDDKFTWLPYQQQPNGQKMMAYDEFWVQDWTTKKYIHNVITGQNVEYVNSDSDFILYADPNNVLLEVTERYVDQHIIVNNQHIHTERNPYGLNEYPFVPFFTIFEPESSDYTLKVQSLIRVMIDPQREANRRRSQMIDIVESQINSGWIAEEDSVVNPQSLYKTSQGQVIWKKRGGQPGNLERLSGADVPQGFFALTQLHDQDIGAVANITEELMGQADSEQDSGLKVMLRQGAALIGLQDVFDGLRFSQECVSKKVLKIIQTWSPEKIKRIINEEPTDVLREKTTMKFDIAVQEGVLTDTQQQIFFRQLIDLKELGEPIPPGLLAKAAPLQGKTEYMQAMEEFNQQQQEAQQKAASIEMEKLRTEAELYQSQSINNIASAKERFTRAVANMGLEDERASKAVENRADAVLRHAQAAKQLEAMDDDKIIKLLEVFATMEEISRMREAELKADDVTISAQADKTTGAQNAR